MGILKIKKISEVILILILTVLIICAVSIFLLDFNNPWQHFSNQAQSFIEGRLDLEPLDPDKMDYVFVNGKYYWPLGLFPSVLLTPFQFLFGSVFHQGSLQLILIILLSLILFRLARIRKFNTLSCFYLTAAFLLGSPVLGLILEPKSSFFAQVVAVTLLSALLLEWETLKRWWFMGILEGALIATRSTSGFIIFALLFLLFKDKTASDKKVVNLLNLLTPVFLSVIAIVWFNFARFGTLLDNGYFIANIVTLLRPLRDIGFFSIQHIPTNFYYYFLASFEAVSENFAPIKFPFIKYSPWGLSFFLVAPFFLYSLKSLRINSLYIKSLWFVVILTLAVLLSYYAPGWVQFGPRYSADFMPVLYLLTLYGLTPPKLKTYQKVIIILSSLLNIYLILVGIFYIE